MNEAVKPARRLAAPERRKAILIAATRVFARAGFHGATTRQLVDTCGLSQGEAHLVQTLYGRTPGESAPAARALEKMK